MWPFGSMAPLPNGRNAKGKALSGYGKLFPCRCHPAQHESMVTSLPKLSAASFRPSTVVR